MLGGVPDFFDVESFNVSVERKFNAAGALYSASQAVVKIRIGEETLISAAEGNGPVNALDLALRKDLGVYQKHIQDLELLDYRVRVFQGGTDAVTRVLIEFGDFERRAMVDRRGLRKHHRRLVPGAGRRDRLQAGEGDRGLNAPARLALGAKSARLVHRPAPRPLQNRAQPLYWVRRRKAATAINGHRNKSFGPGGGTRRLHPSPREKRVSAGAK